jgi:hypothetical protein
MWEFRQGGFADELPANRFSILRSRAVTVGAQRQKKGEADLRVEPTAPGALECFLGRGTSAVWSAAAGVKSPTRVASGVSRVRKD